MNLKTCKFVSWKCSNVKFIYLGRLIKKFGWLIFAFNAPKKDIYKNKFVIFTDKCPLFVFSIISLVVQVWFCSIWSFADTERSLR